ncbi:CPBP family intramembrane glutamic endopeptidase [Clostridium sp. C8-1-8]|uniref:CPBP family intramembrane glutamic endopeptidase n=1 Tax=Clostridium sp. C8-1-8 TaxID=2698831 RepID=UPI00136BF9DC|nr:CPBP family intramembrane glutamic endopeptidase [Clostridium sp. C8-1-8]
MLNKLKSNYSEVIFILVFLVLYAISFTIPADVRPSSLDIVGILYRLLNTILPIVFILIFFPTDTRHYSDYKDRNKLILFFINIPLLFLIMMQIIIQVNSNFTRISVILASLLAIIIYLSKYNKRRVPLTCRLKGVIFIIITFLLYKLPLVLLYHTIFTNHYTSIEFVIAILSTLIFTALTEEVIFRDFLLFGLISRGISPKSANMIQAIIFGLIHIAVNRQARLKIYSGSNLLICSILTCSFQVLIGYLFGKIVIKSKSIGCSVILHTLIDFIN